MQIERLDIPDVIRITPTRHRDVRGFFSETFNAASLAEAIGAASFAQDNHSYSAKAGTVRGLHYQHPQGQGKLIDVWAGRIYDVAVSDGREIGQDGRCETPVGDTVDAAEASYRNSIGETSLEAVWRDPDFDPEQRAFYYVRVLEIPTPRWTTRDSRFFGVEIPEDVPVSIQERAYTSPIWYQPQMHLR